MHEPIPGLSDAERELIEMIRQAETDGDNTRLVIERSKGTWKIVVALAPYGEPSTASGIGRSFDDAWAAIR